MKVGQVEVVYVEMGLWRWVCEDGACEGWACGGGVCGDGCVGVIEHKEILTCQQNTVWPHHQ